MAERQWVDGRVQRGNDARRAVLELAVQTASVDGLEGLSLGRLAGELGVSKSGLFALFGSKEELQLATVEAAKQIFIDRVVSPALRVPQGVGRVRALCDAWLAYSRSRVFAGGCFFASANAEFGARPGRIRDELIAAHAGWYALVADVVDRAAVDRAARASMEDADPGPAGSDQVAFELIAVMETANAWSVLRDDQGAYDRARRSVNRILAAEFGE